MKRFALIAAGLLTATSVQALPKDGDRVYTADQNSNTVSVIDPVKNETLGQIKLGDPRPNVLSPLYKGQVNVHGLGFSPDQKTVVAVSTVTNSVTFIDAATNTVKGTAYIGRNPHEAVFTPDGKEVWATVRGEDHLAVIDPATFKETGQIKTTSGPGMTIFSKDGKLAFVANSFNPQLDVIDVATKKIIKQIKVVSPFSPFIQVTPDGSEAWMTQKDVGKVTRIDTKTLEVKGVIDSGPISNHLAFGASDGRTLAYVTIGGQNVVKVYTLDDEAKLVATIPVGALPHGIWASGDGSRLYVGLENGDGVDVIDAKTNTTVAHMAVGQAPQALIYVPGAAPAGSSVEKLTALKKGPENLTLNLKAPNGGMGVGQVVARNLGLIDIIEVSVAKLKPDTAYSVFVDGAAHPVLAFRTNEKGAAMASATGPVRSIAKPNSRASGAKLTIVESETAKSTDTPALSGG